ncbi:MAG: 4Fe-4S dicluster domain-containing protein [Planctomycetes bacterium]|nr:4Fe-4S dicluster domain-containing protein [Planctomycetota bacterium]
MELNRRQFLHAAGCTGLAAGAFGQSVSAGVDEDAFGVLVDIPNCIGCRKCEFACQKAAGFDTPSLESFDDKSVFSEHRRPHPHSYTTVNRFENSNDRKLPIYVKANCLHCNEPACVSACLVGALRKQPEGPVTYDAWKCMGCRYCMVACPFQIPAYDYHNPLTPQVRKCTFCADRISKVGGVPACVQICPRECLIFGKRRELLNLGHERIRNHPDQYIDHVYGEHEAGGTSWLYLSSLPFEQIGFLTLGSEPPSHLTETIQHTVFKKFVPPIALYGLLGLIMWLHKSDAKPELKLLNTNEEEREFGDEERQLRMSLGGGSI